MVSKKQKYQSLAHYIAYRMPVVIIPVMVGCTGVVSFSCICHLRCILDFLTDYFLIFKRQPLL